MHRILPNLILMLVFVGFFLYSMHKDRSRYRNTVLLLFAGLSLLSLIYSGQYDVNIDHICDRRAGFSDPAILLIFNGFFMIKREGHSLGNLLSFLLGLILLIGELSLFLWFFSVLVAPELHINMRLFASFSPYLAFFGVSTSYLSVVFMSFLLYCLFLQIIPHRRDFDYVIIHGAGIKKDGTVTKLLADRCDKAIEIYRKDPTPPYLVPSGGQGGDEVCSEAEAMANYLISQGIPEDMILKEDIRL